MLPSKAISLESDYRSEQMNKEKSSKIDETYANRSIKGAQFFSAMNPLSFFLHFSTAFLYSSLTVGYDFPMLKSERQKKNVRNLTTEEQSTYEFSIASRLDAPNRNRFSTRPNRSRSDTVCILIRSKNIIGNDTDLKLNKKENSIGSNTVSDFYMRSKNESDSVTIPCDFETRLRCSGRWRGHEQNTLSLVAPEKRKYRRL